MGLLGQIAAIFCEEGLEWLVTCNGTGPTVAYLFIPTFLEKITYQ